MAFQTVPGKRTWMRLEPAVLETKIFTVMWMIRAKARVSCHQNVWSVWATCVQSDSEVCSLSLVSNTTVKQSTT